MRSEAAPRGWVFAVTLVASTLLYLWPGVYFFGHRHWLGTAVIGANLLLCLEYHRRYSADLRDWGFSWTDFFPALRLVLLFTPPVLLLIVFTGLQLGSLVGRDYPTQDLLGLFLWALAQQFALQTLLLRELRRRLSRPRAVVLAAGIFALLHLPNPFLLLLTFGGALLWCWVFSRHPNLLPLALSHSLCTLLILASLSGRLTGSLRVGYSYLLLP